MTGAVARMQRLIDALLDYSRVLRHTRPLVRVDLNVVLRGVIDDLEERLRETGGEVQIPALPTVWGDASLLGWHRRICWRSCNAPSFAGRNGERQL